MSLNVSTYKETTKHDGKDIRTFTLESLSNIYQTYRLIIILSLIDTKQTYISLDSFTLGQYYYYYLIFFHYVSEVIVSFIFVIFFY